MKNMKKILFGLGTVAAVAAPVAAVVACDSNDSKDKNTEWTSSANQWGVKSAAELKNLLGTELKAATLNDADAAKIFTTIGGVDGKELLLNVFTKTAVEFAIVVEGVSLQDATLTPAVPAADLEAKYGIKNAELAKGSHVILIDAKGTINVQDVLVDQDEKALGLLA